MADITLPDFANRCFKNFDTIHKKIDVLDTRQCKLESKFDTHLKVEAALDEQKKVKKESNNNKFYIIIAIIGTSYGLIEGMRGFFS